MDPEKYELRLEGAGSTGVLLTTKWSQSGNLKLSDNSTIDYNEYCPTDTNTGRKSITGCTNTAAAQIIYYYIAKKGLDLQLTLTVEDEYTSGGCGKPQISIKADGSTPGTLSFAKINSMLSSYSTSSASDAAALLYACGVVQEADYSSSATSTAWRNDLFRRAGMASVNSVGLYSGSNSRWGSQGKISDAGFEVLIENLMAGQVVGTSYPGHALVIDGYNPEDDTFHINFGWGSNSATRWYTRDEINEKEYYSFIYDLKAESDYSCTVTNNKFYGTGSLLRAGELANGDLGENRIIISSDLKDKVLSLNEDVSFYNDVTISNFSMDLLSTDKYYGFYASASTGNEIHSLSYDNFSGSIINNGGSYADGIYVTGDFSLNFDGDGALIFAGTHTGSLTGLLGTLKNVQSSGSELSDSIKSAAANAIYSGRNDDRVVLDNKSLVVGNISLGQGDDEVIIRNGSRVYGNLTLAPNAEYSDAVNTLTIDSSSFIAGSLSKNTDICIDLLNKENSNAVLQTNAYSMPNEVEVDLTFAEDGTYKLIEATLNNYYLSSRSVRITGTDSEAYTLKVGESSKHAALYRDGNVLKLQVKDYDSTDNVKPDTPLKSTVDVAHEKATIKWDEVSDNVAVQGYQVRYGKTSSLSGRGESVKGNTITLSSLDPGKYYYQIRAYDGSKNCSAWSSVKAFNVIGDDVDLVVDNYKISKSSIARNQSITVSFDITNYGNKDAGKSTATIYDGSKALKNFSVKALKSGESQQFTYTIAPNKLGLGTRKIMVVADRTKKVDEAFEDNNRAYKNVKVISPADLVVKGFSTSKSTIPNNSKLSLSFYVANNGDYTANASKAYLYDGSKRIASFNIGALKKGASQKVTYTIDTSKLAVGAHALKVVADGAKKVAESNENNNSASKKVNVTKAMSDLQLSKFAAVSSATTAEKVQLSFIVSNKGNKSAPASKAYIYDNGRRIGSVTVGALAVGASRKVTYTIAPGKISAGTHSLMVFADGAGKIAESNERNNMASRNIKITRAASDLRIYKLSAASSATTADKVKVSFVVSNKGNLAAKASKAYIYDGSKCLGAVTVSALAAGASKKVTYTIPAGKFSVGSRNLKVVADGNKKISELNENNNTASRSIKIAQAKSDLRTTRIVVPSNVTNVDNLKLTFTVTNSGKVTAKASKAYIYDGSKRIATVTVGAIAPGRIRNIAVNIAAGKLAAGTHTLKVVVDGNKKIAESNEKNNTTAKSVKILPARADLLIKSFTAASEADSKEPLVLKFTVTNSGKITAKASKAYIYDGSKCLGAVTVGAIAPGRIRNVVFTVPSGKLTDGSHALKVVIDGNKKITESNEKNNTALRNIEIFTGQADLSASLSSTRIMPDRSVEIMVTAVNNGNSASGVTEIALRQAGSTVKELVLPTLKPGESTSIMFRSEPLENGEHNFSVVLDPNEKVAESNEANNIVSTVVNITPESMIKWDLAAAESDLLPVEDAFNMDYCSGDNIDLTGWQESNELPSLGVSEWMGDTSPVDPEWGITSAESIIAGSETLFKPLTDENRNNNGSLA